MSKLNEKGQSLALFIILIPLIIMFSSFVIDTGYMKYNKSKLDDINKIAVNYSLDNMDIIEEEKINYLIKKNDDEIDEIQISINTDEKSVSITIEKSFKGIFGYFLDKDVYDAKSSYKGTIIDDKKIIERVD